MHVVQVTIDQVVNVVTMRHRFVPTAGAVNVVRVVTAALVVRSALGWIYIIDRDDVLIDVVIMRVVKVAIVEIIHVTIVHHGHVTAVRAMGVVVVAVNMAWVVGH